MAESIHSSEEGSGVHKLYVKKHSKLSMRLEPGELNDAFLEMYRDDLRQEMGKHALIFYSDPQESIYRPGSETEKLDSLMTRRLAHLQTRQYKPARWVDPVRTGEGDAEPNTTLFRLNVMLDAETQEQLHAGLHDGLDQSLFGKRAVALALAIPDTKIVEGSTKRREASRRIAKALWADDASRDGKKGRASHPLEVARGQRNVFTHIDWTTRTF